MKKALKIIMVLIMLVGFAFSILNFISTDTVAQNAKQGIYDLETGKCLDMGDECDLTPRY